MSIYNKSFKKDRLIYFYMFIAIFCVILTVFSCGTLSHAMDVAKENEELKEKVLQYEEAIDNYEMDIIEVDKQANMLQDRLNASYEMIESRDKLFLKLGYQPPRELVPCFNCGSSVYIVDEGTDEEPLIFVKCNGCEVCMGPYCRVDDAAGDWNFVDILENE